MKSLGFGKTKVTVLAAVLLLLIGDAALGDTSGDLGSETFSDVAPGHWADEAIGWALENGITQGVSEDLFDPDGILTKAQIFTLLHRTVNVLHTGTAGGNAAEGIIAFTSTRDGDPEILTMNADGTNLRQLTKNTHNDTSPSWSPDGTQIVFQSDRDGDLEIFTMDADGANVRQLTKNTHRDTSPSWSPDGRHIALSATGKTSPTSSL
ncbi:MAG: S-layer homology domain-containing protein [bacterium]|nr:S-layer homology domain-containing protein [bacterium]MDE0601854.1 S-layer homology domain-containing protein [bacterium]